MGWSRERGWGWGRAAGTQGLWAAISSPTYYIHTNMDFSLTSAPFQPPFPALTQSRHPSPRFIDIFFLFSDLNSQRSACKVFKRSALRGAWIPALARVHRLLGVLGKAGVKSARSSSAQAAALWGSPQAGSNYRVSALTLVFNLRKMYSGKFFAKAPWPGLR